MGATISRKMGMLSTKDWDGNLGDRIPVCLVSGCEVHVGVNHRLYDAPLHLITKWLRSPWLSNGYVGQCPCCLLVRDIVHGSECGGIPFIPRVGILSWPVPLSIVCLGFWGWLFCLVLIVWSPWFSYGWALTLVFWLCMSLNVVFSSWFAHGVERSKEEMLA